MTMIHITKEKESAWCVEVLSASLVKPIAQGAATNWITRMMAIKFPMVRPSTVTP